MYTVKTQKPQITFYTEEEEIAPKSGTAVKITYADNKNAVKICNGSYESRVRELYPALVRYINENSFLTTI